MDIVRDLAYQGRGFLKDYRDKKWQKAEGNVELHDGKYATSVVAGNRLRLAFSIPKKEYVEANLAKSPRPDPFPTLVSLIEEKDYSGKQWPGEDLVARRYGTNAAYKELLERWIVLAPLAVRGNYLEDGKVRGLFFNDQIKDFYQRYHVDFERLVLDGDAGTVLAIASMQPSFFAGLVVRKPIGSSPEIDPDVVVNYGPVPVFVVDDEAIYAKLKEAGHPDVKKGTDAEAMEWLKARRRKAPKSFAWRAKTTQQVLAHWLYFDPDWNAQKRTLKVEVLDTKEDPNTIKIEAVGIFNLSALLNDDIVDLRRPVRVVINGKEAFKQVLERSLEQFFERDPVSARLSMWYGNLISAILPRTFVPDPPPVPSAPVGTSTAPAVPTPGTPGKPGEAEDLLKRAKGYEAEGNTDAAETAYKRILEKHPASPQAAEAKAALARLKGDGGGTGSSGAPPAPAAPGK
jgi:hypothetical protein